MMRITPWPVWIAFIVVTLGLVGFDLFAGRNRSGAISAREAILKSVCWVVLSLLFGLWIAIENGMEVGWQFYTAYLVEYSLSADNIFVFVLIFSFFRVPAADQPRVLVWGVLGALVLRGLMIAIGAELLARYSWMPHVFGIFLLVTGIRMLWHRGEEMDLTTHPLLRWIRRILRLTDDYRGSRFAVREQGRLSFTPLFLVLVVIELTDLLFAVDSIPAVFSITRHPFVVFSSNVCAILGLRSLYFLLAGAVHQLHYLKPALAIILVFIGLKMFAASFWEMPNLLSLGIVLFILAVAIVASIVRERHLKVAAGS